MIRLLVRRTPDVRYYTDDPADELRTLRAGGPGWRLRGTGDVNDPREVARTLTTSERSTVWGYDLVVAAPRPFSILLAIDPAAGRSLVEAHRVSVAAAMDYLEERALTVRDRRGGEDRELAARWASVIGFTHGVNRHGEPHLHDHVLVGARPAHSVNVLDARALRAHVGAADALYRASLRVELSRRTPWVAWRLFRGVEHVGLDEGYRVLWGGHHDERGEKRYWRREEVVERWRLDLDRFESAGVVVTPPRRREVLDEHAFAAAFEGRDVVARRDVVRAWADAAVFGQSPARVTAAVDSCYPGLSHGRGVREVAIGVEEARQIRRVREHGPRPLDAGELDRWRQRSREREAAGRERSR